MWSRFLFTASKLSYPAINKNDERNTPNSILLFEIVATQNRSTGYFNNGINLRNKKCLPNKRYKTTELVKSKNIIEKTDENTRPIIKRYILTINAVTFLNNLKWVGVK